MSRSRSRFEALPMLLLSLIGLTLTLNACATTTASSDAVKAACIVWQPISWADADTDETIRDVKRNNAAWSAFCKDQGGKK